jgi:voltage-gated sodium channel
MPSTAARTLVESPGFQRLSIGAILVSAILIGAELYVPALKVPFFWMQKACVLIFMIELGLRWAGRRNAREFFADGWNIFDIIVIVASFLPASGGFAPIVRVLRVLRVFRLARNIPELRLIVTVLLKSVVSMKYVALLALLCFFIFAVMGVKLFGARHAEFATLHESFFTLFRVLTGDDWSQLRYDMKAAAAQAVSEAGTLLQGDIAADAVAPTLAAPPVWVITAYFVGWILIATFVLVNLLVGAIINNYQEVQNAERGRIAGEQAGGGPQTPQEEARSIDARVGELAEELQKLSRRRAELNATRKDA